MNKIIVPLVEIELDRKRHFRLDFNALARAEEVTGKNFLSGISWAAISAKDLRALVWACLIHEDPELKLEEVGTMLSLVNVNEVVDALSKIWEASSPKTEEGGPLAENLLPGSSSGQ